MEIYYCPSHYKRKTQFQRFYRTHIEEIPTNKGANSYKLNISKIGNFNFRKFQSAFNLYIYTYTGYNTSKSKLSQRTELQ